MSQTLHAKLSPSARVRWANCPGSPREEAKYPPKPSGPAAIDGTHSHSLLELSINEYIDPTLYVGNTLKDHEGEFTVDAERAERVQFAVNYIEERVIEIDCNTIIAERHVNPVGLLGRDDLSGTVDVTLVTPEVVEVIDYKDGMNATDAREQLEQYAVGIMSGMRDRGETIPQNWVLTVIQPKLRLKGMKGIISREVSLGELAQIAEVIKQQAAATDAPDAPLVPGEAQCKYCAHAGACSARANSTMAAAGVVFKDLTATVTDQSAAKEPTTMTDKQLVEILEAAPMLRQMIEGAEAEALRRLEAGNSIDGIKAVRGRGSRAWAVSDEQEMADKLKKFGLPKDVIWATKLISVAQAEKASWTKTKDGQEVKMQLSDRQLKTLKSEYTKTTEGKITVALASDPRPAVTLSVVPLFAAVPTVTELPSFLL
jgi:hypothetical protein